MRVRDLFESPIADLQYFDRSAEGEGHSFGADDRKALESPKWKAKVVKLFRNTVEPVNVYAVNSRLVTSPKDEIFLVNPSLYGIKDWSGIYSPEEFEKNFRFLPPDYNNAINVVLLHNHGDDRVPLTPWMLAHRIIHAFGSSGLVGRSYSSPMTWGLRTAFRNMSQAMGIIEENFLGYSGSNFRLISERDRMYAILADFGSARNHKIARSGEFIVELFTQYFLKGDFTFRAEDILIRDIDVVDLQKVRKLVQKAKESLDQCFKEAVGNLVVF